MNNTNKVTLKNIFDLLFSHNIIINYESNENIVFNDLKSLSTCGIDDLTFFSDESSIDLLKSLNAKACLISKNNSLHLSSNVIPIIVDDVYKAFAIISNLFSTEKNSNGTVSNFSLVEKGTVFKENIQIDPFVHIATGCIIHKNVIIESGCSIGPNVIIGENTIIKSNSTILYSTIGRDCIIKSGAVIGGTGFGFDSISKIRINHKGSVEIGKNCNIGSNSTIDRAVFDSTIISDNCFIDNLVQIAHNVKLGNGCIVAGQVGIAGSAIIGSNTVIGGQVGISGHIKIGNNVKIAAKSGVTKNINDNSVVAGFPAINIKKWKMNNIKINRL